MARQSSVPARARRSALAAVTAGVFLAGSLAACSPGRNAAATSGVFNPATDYTAAFRKVWTTR